MQNTNVPQGWNFSEFGTFAFLAKDKYEPDANEHKRCIELEHIEKETGKLISVSDSSTHTSVKNKFAINDVLFGKLRPYLKKYYKPDFEGVCSTEIWVLRGKQAILQEYLFLLIQSDKFLPAKNIPDAHHNVGDVIILSAESTPAFETTKHGVPPILKNKLFFRKHFFTKVLTNLKHFGIIVCVTRKYSCDMLLWLSW
jgi:hypothetical protein